MCEIKTNLRGQQRPRTCQNSSEQLGTVDVAALSSDELSGIVRSIRKRGQLFSLC